MSYECDVISLKRLRSVGASFFISYLYHNKINHSHTNWEIISKQIPRINTINNNEEFHKDWINKIINMNPSKLSNNKIGLSGLQVISMAKELKSYYKF